MQSHCPNPPGSLTPPRKAGSCLEWVDVPMGTRLGGERCCPAWGFGVGCVMGRDNGAWICWRRPPAPCINPTRAVTSSKPSRDAHGSGCKCES